jgi:hypothetical protein
MSLKFSSDFDPKKLEKQIIEDAKKQIEQSIKKKLAPLSAAMAKEPKGKVDVKWNGKKADVIVTGYSDELMEKITKLMNK